MHPVANTALTILPAQTVSLSVHYCGDPGDVSVRSSRAAG